MIAAWMVYAIAVSTLFGLAAAALERSVRYARRPGRWLVAAGLLLSLVVPLVARSEVSRAAPVAGGSGGVVQSTAAERAWLPRAGNFETLDVPLLLLWAASSLAMAGLLFAAQRSVRRDASRGIDTLVHGVPVRRTERFGPAVIGGLRSVIVLPSWVDTVDDERRRLMVLHEHQHLRAGDSRLLFGAVLLAVLQPWNPALWWQLKRLKAALELDCDQRVLATGVDLRAYGRLLLEVTTRRVATPLGALAFSNRQSLIARRIDIMTDHASRTRYVRAALGAAVSTVLVAVGCQTPSPVEVDGPNKVEMRAAQLAADSSFTLHTDEGDLMFDFQFSEARRLARHLRYIAEGLEADSASGLVHINDFELQEGTVPSELREHLEGHLPFGPEREQALQGTLTELLEGTATFQLREPVEGELKLTTENEFRLQQRQARRAERN